ncbi:MAG TPA: trigger factor [Porticoccaceae bacterium]|nr:trigger factor [Porticoccaceae bacterium]
MQVSVEKTSVLERRLTIGVAAAEVDEQVQAKLKESAGQVRLPGFRPGKVPLKVVQQRFGKGIRQEVVGEVISRSFYEAITQEELKPAGQPDIEPINDEAGKDLEYAATFEVYPEIELKDFSTIEITKPVAEITDEDVDKTIANIREQRGEWVVVERTAADKDQVNIDYAGTRDGEAFEGGAAEGSDLILGSGRMIPGFEEAIVGMSAGEEKVVALTFPEDYSSEELRGASVEFNIKVNTVSERQLPELNDDLFAEFGVSEGGESAFRAEVRDNMQKQLDTATRTKLKFRLFKALEQMHDFEKPRALINSEIAAVKQQMLSQFAGGQPMDSSLFPDDLFAPEAEKRVTLGLLIAEISQAAELEVDDAMVRARIEEQAATYEQPEQVIQYYYTNEQALNGIQSAVMEDQVVEHVLEQVKISEETVSYAEALQPDAPEEPEDGGDDSSQSGEPPTDKDE